MVFIKIYTIIKVTQKALSTIFAVALSKATTLLHFAALKTVVKIF